jgi:tetratricopeptide (TPR) repeat protein
MKKIIFVITFIISITLISCEDFLVREPVTGQSENLVFSTFEGFNSATLGVYAPMYSVDWYGAAFMIHADLKADNAKSSPVSSGRYQSEYNWAQNASTTNPLWNVAYITITNACNVIDAVDELELPAGDSLNRYEHLKAEALFARALGHFDLVRTYAQPYSYQPNGLGVPIIVHTSLQKPARNTTQEVYDQILEDLLEAERILSAETPEFVDAFNEEFRSGVLDVKATASLEAVQGLLARVYLYMENYTKASEYATKVIDGDNTLYDETNYMAVWGTDAASEILFEIYGNYNQSYAPYWEEIGRMIRHDGYGDVCATNGLVDLYDPADVRLGIFNEPAGYPGYFWPQFKYPGKGDPRQNNIPVLRLSEMYLIRAEARLNGAAGDPVADYNAIVENRGLAGVSSVTMDDIFNERRRELCFEGHLLYDYARLQKSLDRVDEDNRITGTEDVDFPSYLWAAPIPNGEMDANENMVQNEGY